jgi:hypothetical protein
VVVVQLETKECHASTVNICTLLSHDFVSFKQLNDTTLGGSEAVAKLQHKHFVAIRKTYTFLELRTSNRNKLKATFFALSERSNPAIDDVVDACVEITAPPPKGKEKFKGGKGGKGGGKRSKGGKGGSENKGKSRPKTTTTTVATTTPLPKNKAPPAVLSQTKEVVVVVKQPPVTAPSQNAFTALEDWRGREELREKLAKENEQGKIEEARRVERYMGKYVHALMFVRMNVF